MNDLAQQLREQVFKANYRRPRQRALRALAYALLIAKHNLRASILFLPIYLILAAFLLQPGASQHWPWLLLLLPGLAWWFIVQMRGARMDYQQQVSNRLLNWADLRSLNNNDD